MSDLSDVEGMQRYRYALMGITPPSGGNYPLVSAAIPVVPSCREAHLRAKSVPRQAKCDSMSLELSNVEPSFLSVIITKSIYIPVDLAEEVEKWTTEYKKVKRLLKEINAIGEQVIRDHGAKKRAVRQKSRKTASTKEI